jgi:hypothetical protein
MVVSDQSTCWLLPLLCMKYEIMKVTSGVEVFDESVPSCCLLSPTRNSKTAKQENSNTIAFTIATIITTHNFPHNRIPFFLFHPFEILNPDS